MIPLDPRKATREQLVAEVDRLQGVEWALVGRPDERAALQVRVRATPGEAQVLLALRRGAPQAYHVLHTAQFLGEERPTTDETRMLKVHITRLRSKLKPFGMAIRNVYGFGYQLENHEKLSDILKGAQ